MKKKSDNLSITRGIGLDLAVTQFEKWYIWWTLERNDFNQSTAAEELKIHRNTLVSRLRDWDWQEKVQAGFDECHSSKIIVARSEPPEDEKEITQ